MEKIVRRLETETEARRTQFREGFTDFARRHDLVDWEGWFSPYAPEIYEAVLDHVTPDDVVLEIGAGDLRLALQLAQRAQRVIAVEVNPLVVGSALETIGLNLPSNLQVMCANALDIAIPSDVSAAVLLMRHCRHFALYFDRLEAAGCERLITNARWKSGVECVDLAEPRVSFGSVECGLYACRCGAVGAVLEGDSNGARVSEVESCPHCDPTLAQ